MRITEEAKHATRGRILDAARRLFASQGFDEATTRDIARAAGIATGTLFNYFATKEAIVMTLVAEALAQGQARFDRQQRDGTSLEERLFAFVAAGLRELKPYRRFLRPALETSLSPLAQSTGNGEGESIRVGQLEAVERIAGRHDVDLAGSPVALQLYWTLYTGVLAFWATDTSPNQEETLGLLDQSLAMYVTWLFPQNSRETASGARNLFLH